MMQSSEGYIMELENASYTELIKERRRLIRYMSNFEKGEICVKRKRKPRHLHIWWHHLEVQGLGIRL